MTSAATLSEARRPRVLFVGHDAGSPQIAADLLRNMAGELVSVETALTQPDDPGSSDELLVAMGLNPAEEHRLSARALRTADRVVILGTDLDVARYPGPRYEEWDLADDDLVVRVRALSDDLTAVAPTRPRTTVRDRLHRLLLALHRRSGR
jgi:hypothetical protein